MGISMSPNCSTTGNTHVSNIAASLRIPSGSAHLLVETALNPLREKAVRILRILDDWLILASSQQEDMAHTALVIQQANLLGFTINYKKSTFLPSQQMLYLGMHLDSCAMHVRLSEEHMVGDA